MYCNYTINDYNILNPTEFVKNRVIAENIQWHIHHLYQNLNRGRGLKMGI